MQLSYEPTRIFGQHNKGSGIETLKMLYLTLIKSKLEYGNEFHKSISETNTNLLIPDRNKALRVATGAFRSYPFDSLENILGAHQRNILVKLV